VVLSHRIPAWNGTTCISYFGHEHNTCLYDTLPFYGSIPWKDIFVEVPIEIFENKTLAPFLKNLKQEVLAAKRVELFKTRSKIMYDWNITRHDAFTEILTSLCDIRNRNKTTF
jgi:hypothetical protein